MMSRRPIYKLAADLMAPLIHLGWWVIAQIIAGVIWRRRNCIFYLEAAAPASNWDFKRENEWHSPSNNQDKGITTDAELTNAGVENFAGDR